MNTPTSIKREMNIEDMAGIVLSSIPAKQTRAVISNQVPLNPIMAHIIHLRETVERIAPTDLGPERVAKKSFGAE